MDKQEYKIRAAEIKDLLDHHQFSKAMEVCNLIDWKRVKNISMLCKVSEIYKVNRKYAEAKDILLIAYDRYPGGKMILYNLCELYIKMGDVVQAWECYKEFYQIAPKDSGVYLLQYKLYEAQDVSLEERIDVLKKYKEKEYHEKWAYELAYLYHKIGQETDCIEECDELILWFGEGKYVTKAMELKKLHQPLSPSQQEKYNAMMGIDPVEDEPENDEINSEDNYDEVVEENDNLQEELKPQTTIHTGETIEIAPVNVDKFSTMNLQAELSKSMQEVMEAEPEAEVLESYDPTIPQTPEEYLDSQIPVYDEPIEFQEETQAEVKEVYATEYVDEETVEGAPSPEGYESALDKTANLGEPIINSLLSQESDGQISLVLPEEQVVDKQITGQMDFTEVMKEWDRLKQEGNRNRIAEAKRKALEKTNDVVSQLQEAFPGMVTAQLPTIDKIDENDYMTTGEIPVVSDEESLVKNEGSDISTDDLPTVEDILSALDNSEKESKESLETTENSEESTSDDYIVEEEIEEEVEEMEEDSESEEDSEENNDNSDALTESLEEEIEENFGEILRLKKMRSVIRETLRKSRMMGNTGNIIITGNESSIRLKYALAVAKSKQHTDVDFVGKIAKIDAATLNKKDVVKAITSLQGGALIIEKAGELNINTLDAMVKTVNNPDSRLLFILEDEKVNIKKLQKMREYVDKVFNISVNIPTFSNNDLVDHAKEYALEREYSIDDMGMLALYKRIDELQTASHYVTIAEVEEIMDEAIAHADKKNMGHLMDILFARRYDDDDLIILKEKDFIKQ